VKIEDDSVEIYSDKLIYHKSNRNSFAYGNVMIKGKYSKAYLFGDTVKHFPNLRHTYVGGSPRLFQIDSIITGIRNELDTTETEDDSNSKQSAMSLRFDTLSVKSRIMESYQKNDVEQEDEIFYFIDSVEIVKGGLAARADTAVYNKTIGKIEMKGRPVVWYDSTQMFADSIIVYVPEMKLAKLHSFGNSVVLSRDDTTDLSKINQIVGNEILIKFENDSINAIFSFGDAKSLYFMESDSVSGGAQRSSCDSLSVLFEFGEVSEINWLGGISGEFFPEELINEPVSLYLPGFKLINNRPRKMSFTLLRYE